MDKRYTVKLTSGGARLAAANNAVLAPCVFGYNGGIHIDFDKILVKMFAHRSSMCSSSRTTYVTHCITRSK